MSNQPPYTQPHFYQPTPEQPPATRLSSTLLWIGGILAVLLVLIFVGAAFILPNQFSGGASASPQTYTFSGDGNKQTDYFTVPENWTLAYTCYGVNGVNAVFSVSTYDHSGILQANSVDTMQCAPNGYSDSTEMHSGGNIYLGILSSGSWTITIHTHP